MQEFQNSNLATYLADGAPVYDTHFVSISHDGERQLFAMRSPHDQRIACDRFGERGLNAETVSHRDAYMMICGGTPAFYHNGDVPAEEVWSPLVLNRGHAIAA